MIRATASSSGCTSGPALAAAAPGNRHTLIRAANACYKRIEMTDKPVVLRAEDLWKEYRDGDGAAVAALRGLRLAVAAGEVVTLLGRSGSGKTTLLNLLAGLDRPTRGRVEVEGADLGTLGERGLTLLRRRRIGFVFQFFNLLPSLTALENVALALELAGLPDDGRSRDALRAVGLDGKERRRPNELSGGEQQRVAVARALVKAPAVILADEPTGNLDTATGDLVLDLLSRRCREAGAALLMATHAPLAAQRADRVLRMVDGALLPAGPAV
ncbi:MAG: ABC transporter ATP-binding protein [Candidatus Methylomirabilia bacterium]